MTVLRTTRPALDHEHPGRHTQWLLGVPRTLMVWLGVVFLAAAGCSGGPPGSETGTNSNSDPAPYRPIMRRLPLPAPDRIVYKAGTLTFYELPGSGRWMVQVSGSESPAPVGTDHRLPEGLDPHYTYVSYCRPGGQTSGRVTLAQIQAAGKDHDSSR